MRKKLATIIAENGLTVVEAKKDTVVTVKKCDASAKRKQPEHCAFAQACRREFGAKRVIFLRSIAYIQSGDKLTRYILPSSVQKEIMAFDRGGRIVPGEYILKAPKRGMTLRAQRRYTKVKRGKAKRQRSFGARHYTAEIRTVQW